MSLTPEVGCVGLFHESRGIELANGWDADRAKFQFA